MGQLLIDTVARIRVDGLGKHAHRKTRPIPFNRMQALGGYAQPEYDMGRCLREPKHAMVGGGANEIHRSIIAKQMEL